jgi:hypothetical protein
LSEKNRIIRLTPRGLATVLAIREGVIPATDDGYDNEAFERFWDRYEVEVKSLQKESDDCIQRELQKSKQIGLASFSLGFGILIGLLLSSL